jgi:hypothetical protein
MRFEFIEETLDNNVANVFNPQNPSFPYTLNLTSVERSLLEDIVIQSGHGDLEGVIKYAQSVDAHLLSILSATPQSSGDDERSLLVQVEFENGVLRHDDLSILVRPQDNRIDISALKDSLRNVRPAKLLNFGFQMFFTVWTSVRAEQ